MTDTVTELAKLEAEMNRLCIIRSERVHMAETQIRHANEDFDRDAVPIARKINALHEQIKPTLKTEPTKRTVRHDPEWLIEDRDHFYELQRREAQNGK